MIVEQFLAKKEQWLAQQHYEKERKKEQDSNKQFISKGSQRIMREKSVTSDRSQGGQSFLQRNYYGAKAGGREGRSQLSSRMDTSRQGGRQSSAASTNNYLRDISGNKISFLHSTQDEKGPVYDSQGNRLFSPKINDRSRYMSPRDKNSTFNMLHLQAAN